jgi:uncharacterized protein (DUF58 family)
MMPLWFLLAIAVLLLLVARWRSAYPHTPLLFLLCLPTLLSVGLIPLPSLWPWLIALDLLMVAIVIADLGTLPRIGTVGVERQLSSIASLGKPHQVTLLISNHGSYDQPVWIRDGLPDGLQADPDKFYVELSRHGRSTVRYRLFAKRRGAFAIESVFIRARSRRGLWQRLLTEPCKSEVHVYPDMKQLEEYAVMARTNRLSLLGMRRTRTVGQDNEFERLRDYTRDDNYRQIDWRATARRQKLIVKDFQANQSQRLVFLVDCGRMMTGESAGVSLLDHAFNAMLMLSYVALRRNDQVGLMCFSDRIHSFVPPAGGPGQTNRLLHATYDRFPEMVESRYDEAFLHLASHVRKRTLVILITNLIDVVNSRQIRRHLQALAGRHLPLGVLLRDHALFDPLHHLDWNRLVPTDAPAATKPTISVPSENRGLTTRQFYTAAAAADIVTWRHRVLTDLEMSGALSLDVFPEDLSASLVNRYLDIKARHLL